ncbi:unnamed protein product [Soboliphyme baturini]|uniref:Uncharacterized protein n=1 Tax=Soboliphyme baturini TaxID=241478 RepID=A0A183J898_9BILA|nr:unnamed protein product [Soboliphyme baturini]
MRIHSCRCSRPALIFDMVVVGHNERCTRCVIRRRASSLISSVRPCDCVSMANFVSCFRIWVATPRFDRLSFLPDKVFFRLSESMVCSLMTDGNDIKMHRVGSRVICGIHKKRLVEIPTNQMPGLCLPPRIVHHARHDITEAVAHRAVAKQRIETIGFSRGERGIGLSIVQAQVN